MKLMNQISIEKKVKTKTKYFFKKIMPNNVEIRNYKIGRKA